MLSFKRVFPNNREEQGLQPIACYGCSKICHRYCYGLETLTKSEEDIEYFVCDVCKVDNKQHQVCIVCKDSNGLLKKLEDGGYIHPICGFTHLDINVTSYLSLTFKRASFYNEELSPCCICQKENAYFKCSEEKCTKGVHPLCVMRVFR